MLLGGPKTGVAGVSSGEVRGDGGGGGGAEVRGRGTVSGAPNRAFGAEGRSGGGQHLHTTNGATRACGVA